MTPGTVSDLSLSDYLALPGLSASELWTFYHRSPFHARRETGREPTQTMTNASLLHALVLEPEAVDGRFYRLAGNLRTKAKREERDEATASGLEIVRAADWEPIEEEAGRVRYAIRDLLDSALHREATLTWEEAEHMLPAKARPDLILPDGPADLKRLRSGHPKSFLAASARYGWHFQAAWYRRGCRAAGMPWMGWAWIVIEAGGPITTYRPSTDDLDRVELRLETVLAEYAECQRADHWPGYESGSIDLSGLLADEDDLDYSDLELEDEDG